jgi:luciferase family oxidoreductase group 1
MAATLLAHTRRLRIGSGGVLLPRYEALKVAEVFRVLAALHPGRVDLGIGRAGGPAHRFPEQLVELAELLATPYQGYVPPELWLLGAGTGSAELAADLGARFCFAHFLRPELGHVALERYRRGKRTSSPGALAVRVVVADTEAKAAALRQSFLLWRSRKDLGSDEPFPSPAATRAHRWTTAESARAAENSRALVTGAPEQVRAALTALVAEHGTDELVINTLTHDPADRLTSYRLLAEAFPARTDGPRPVGSYRN